ncbi:MAG: BatA domain-containing protein [Thermomicrobiales bacterium]
MIDASWGLLGPLGLFAGISLGVILLLHMRRQIPERRIVPSIRFWSESRHDDLERSKLRKPPLSWLLVLQLLAALLITLALARPVIDGLLGAFASRTSPEHQILILDGSTSMQAVSKVGSATTRFTEARQQAADVFRKWQAGDITTLLVAGSRIQSFTASNQQQAAALATLLAKMAPPGGRADINATLRLAGDLLLPNRINRITVLTDGAVSVDPAIAAAISAPIQLSLLSGTSAPTNDAIVAISSRTDLNQPTNVRVAFTIAHFGDQAATIPYSASTGNNDVADGSITLGPDESRQVEVSVPADASGVVVSIPQQDVLQADNSASLQLQRDELSQLKIMLVTDSPGQLQRALGVIPGTHVDVYPGATPGLKALASGYDLAVFAGVTPAVADRPAIPMLFFQPQPLTGTFVVSGALAAPSIDRVESGAALLNGVDLAGVTFTDAPVYDLPGGATELVGGVSADGTHGPLIWKGSLNSQPFIATAFTPESSNIGQRVAFPILVANAVSTLTTDQIPGALALGDPLTYTPSVGTAKLSIQAPDGSTSILPVSSGDDASLDRAVTFADTDQSGVYTLSEIAIDGSTTRHGSFVVNAGQLQESNLRPNPDLASALSQTTPPNGHVQSVGVARSELWPFLIALALLIVCVEWFLASRSLGTVQGRRRTLVSSQPPAPEVSS